MLRIAPRIVVDQGVRFGKPVIEGTRVPVDLVLGKLAGGMTMEVVAEEYDFTREDILAALAYAARTSRRRRFGRSRRWRVSSRTKTCRGR
jgi:uncharacterized protein (DUF433 family)